MCYVCQCCGAASRPGQSRLVFTVWRPKGFWAPPRDVRALGAVHHADRHIALRDLAELRRSREVAQELAVCPDCKAKLDRGFRPRFSFSQRLPRPRKTQRLLTLNTNHQQEKV